MARPWLGSRPPSTTIFCPKAPTTPPCVLRRSPTVSSAVVAAWNAA